MRRKYISLRPGDTIAIPGPKESIFAELEQPQSEGERKKKGYAKHFKCCK